MLYPKGIVVIHDVMPKVVPEVARSLGLISRTLLYFNYRAAAKHSDKLVTVSHYSARDISETYNIPLDSISVIGNAWQHINGIAEDDRLLNTHPGLRPGKYYFTLSANRIQKNFKWIYEVAKRNPDEIFAMAGTQEEWQRNMEYDAPNIIHLGYITNEEVKSLMRSCKAFLFPSTYEGFGIPPLEALACGAKIIVSKASCLPEIYGGSAYYIDPYDYDVDLNELLCNPVEPANVVLEKYGWDKSAQKMYELCQQLDSLL